jgi:hypothetical protein
LRRALSSFKGTLSSWQRSEFSLVKVHAMTHYIDSIRRAGSPFEYSVNMYEHLHIVLIKQAYQGSNRRDHMGHIAKHNLRLQTLQRVVGNMDGFEAPLERVIALDKVSSQMLDKCYI